MNALRHLALIYAISSSLLTAAPAWTKDLTSPAPGSFPKPVPSVLEMNLSWKGAVDSGVIRIEFAPPDAKKSGRYVVKSSAASKGAAAILFPYQSHFWSEIDPTSLRPKFFQAVETDKKETVTTTARHLPTQTESSEVTKVIKSGKTKQTDRVFKISPAFDLFSAILHVRSQKLDNGDQIVLLLHPFDNPYLMRLNVVGREQHLGRDAIRMTLKLQKIDRKTMELRSYKKVKREITLWLSDDKDRIPLEIRADAFIGDVRAVFSSHTKL